MTSPQSVRIRMYNVGFGDSLLVTFTYAKPVGDEIDPTPRLKRHILFDCGTTSRARSGLTTSAVAKLVAAECEDGLDALVISHRHRDHLSAFGAATVAELFAPRVVARSWTEAPELDANAGHAGDAGVADTEASPEVQLLDQLNQGVAMAARIVDQAARVGRGSTSNVADAADDELANAAAIESLRALADDGRGEYLHALSDRTRLSALVPGVQFHVLGPPKPSYWPQVAEQAEDSAEYWATAPAQVDRLFTDDVDLSVPLGTQRWIHERMHEDEQRQLVGLVRWLDDAMNNTSLIVLIEIGEHRLLFPGDAQIENWNFALNGRKDERLASLLDEVDFYKVGHHGSRNGTPISLHGRWSAARRRGFTAMMSTKPNVHGEGERRVPREPLMKALRTLGTLVSTDDSDADWWDAEAKVPKGRFVITEGPVRTPKPAP